MDKRNIDCKGSIEKVLNEIFKNTNVEYMINGNEVVLKVKSAPVAPQQTKQKSVLSRVQYLMRIQKKP